MGGGFYFSASATSSPVSGCLSPTSASSFVTSFTRDSGTVSTKNGSPLCQPATLVLESFTVPSTWDRKGANSSSVPQTEFAAVNVNLPANKSYITQTATVPVPPSCQNTQIDFYFPPAYPAILTVHADSGRIIGGSLFAGMGSCTTPTPSPSPTPTPTPTPTPSPTPSGSPSPSPSYSPSPSPSSTPGSSLVCTALSASPTSGPAPLTVNFTGSGSATGQTTLTSYEFQYGDNNQITTTKNTSSHTYTTPGVYTATLTLTGSSGNQASAPACLVSITVGGGTSTPSPTPPGGSIILAQTGVTGQIMTFLGALLVTAGLIHIWLTQRKKIIVSPKKR
jgi:PKD repeat protein